MNVVPNDIGHKTTSTIITTATTIITCTNSSNDNNNISGGSGRSFSSSLTIANNNYHNNNITSINNNNILSISTTDCGQFCGDNLVGLTRSNGLTVSAGCAISQLFAGPRPQRSSPVKSNNNTTNTNAIIANNNNETTGCNVTNYDRGDGSTNSELNKENIQL